MKPRDMWNILLQVITAAWWSAFTSMALLIPMVLLGVPLRVAFVVTVTVSVVISGLTLYGAVCLHRERQRRSKGQCIRCGYDLTGSVDKCPECGKRFRRVAA